MSFHEVLFPAAVSFGSTGGPERRTEIVTLASGFEERNATWAHSRRSYDAGVGLRGIDDIHAVVAFYEARLGQLYAFRWKDWADYRSCQPSAAPSASVQLIGEGDGARTGFQLAKTYASGPAAYTRPIRKPVAGSVVVAVDGAIVAEGEAFTLDATTGLIEFAAPPVAGAAITAGFEFHVPVRFDTEKIEVNLAAFEAGEIPSIPLIEVRI